MFVFVEGFGTKQLLCLFNIQNKNMLRLVLLNFEKKKRVGEWFESS